MVEYILNPTVTIDRYTEYRMYYSHKNKHLQANADEKWESEKPILAHS